MSPDAPVFEDPSSYGYYREEGGGMMVGLFEPRARVFAMTSEGGRRVWPAYGPVAAAKSALESLVRQLAVELAPREITVNALCPGYVETDIIAHIDEAQLAKTYDEYMETIGALDGRLSLANATTLIEVA